MVEKFLEYLKHEKNYSPHTLVSYRNDMEQFVAYLKDSYEIEKPEEASSLMVRSWLGSLMQEKVSARSVIRKASTLRTYYKFLLREGIITKSPMAKVTAPKAPQRLPVFVNKSEMETLFKVADFPQGYQGMR